MMIKILQPGDEQRLERFLQPRLDSSMFLLGNMRAYGLLDQGERYQGTYAAAFEAGEIVGVAAHVGNGNLLVQAPTESYALCQAAIQASNRGVMGLVGPHEQVERVKARLDIDPSIVQLAGKDWLYSLPLSELVIPNILKSGAVQGRRIEPKDLDIVSEWSIAYEIETLGGKDTPELRKEARRDMERNRQEGRTWILEKEGQPIAQTSFNTTIQEAVQVGGVYTPPELRGRGYGRAVVAVSLLDAIADGAEKAILFTDEQNIAAQKAYTALGFRHIGAYQLLLLHSPISF